MRNHGVDLDTVRPRLIDHVALMRELWTDDEGTYSGDYCSVEPSWSWPKPVQQPAPPLHVGARATSDVFDDIATWADGWLPIEGHGDVIDHLPRLRHAFEQHDRDPETAVVTVYSSQGDPALLAGYHEAGINRVVIWLPPADEATVLAALDTHTHQLSEYLS